MIAYLNCRCAGCLSFATREFVDEYGERLPLCDRCPSPDEIERRTAEVRASWDDVDYWCRRYGLPREVAIAARSVDVRVVAVVPPSLPARHGRSVTPTET